MKHATRITGILIVWAVMLMLAAAGCGGGGGGAAVQTITGSVLTPGGTQTGRIASRSASDLANVSASVPIAVYSVNSAGAKTLIASGQTTIAGVFSISLPAGVSYTSSLLIVTANFGNVSLRSFVTTASNVAVSPITEAAVNIIESQIEQSGASYNNLTLSEISTIQTQVNSALSSETFSGTISDAVNSAVTIAKRDASVKAAVDAAIGSTTQPVTLAVFTTTDYSSGALSSIPITGNLTSTPTASINITTVHSDATVVADGRYAYVINRYGGDNIQVLDASNGFSLVAQYSTGNGTNPQDIKIVSSSKAYISLLGADHILIVNPTTGAQLGTIELSSFADQDGLPEMGQMLLIDGKMFVAIQNLNNWTPVNPGKLAVIDTVTDTLVDTDPATAGTQGVSLAGQNPTFMVYNEATAKIYVSCSDVFSETTFPKGIDAVDPQSYQVTHLIDKTALKGSPNTLAVISSSMGYVVVSDASFTNTVITFNPTTGAVGASVYRAGGYVPSIAVDPYGYVLVADQDYYSPGIVFIDTRTNTVVKGPVSVGLPPFGISFVSY